MTDTHIREETGRDEAPSILEEEPDTEQAENGGHDRAGALESLLDGLTEAGEGAAPGDAGTCERAGTHERSGTGDRTRSGDDTKSGGNAVTIDALVEAFEQHSIGALISVIALISALPLVGGIPGVTLITATMILLVIGQSLVHRRGGLWVPRFLGQRSISAETLEKGVERARPWVRRIDRWMYPRLQFLTHGRPQRLLMTLAIILLTLSFYPLNFIPYAVTPPSLGVLAFGLALMTGDGYLALFGYAMAAATLGIGAEVLSGGFAALQG